MPMHLSIERPATTNKGASPTSLSLGHVEKLARTQAEDHDHTGAPPPTPPLAAENREPV